MKDFLKKFSIKETLKFCVGGGSAVLVDFLSYIFLKQYIQINPAKALSFVLGALVGFIINKLWTFESRSFKISEILKYIILYACSALANTLVNKLVLSVFDSVVFAFLCATGVSTIMNFLGQKFFVFSKKSKNNENSQN